MSHEPSPVVPRPGEVVARSKRIVCGVEGVPYPFCGTQESHCMQILGLQRDVAASRAEAMALRKVVEYVYAVARSDGDTARANLCYDALAAAPDAVYVAAAVRLTEVIVRLAQSAGGLEQVVMPQALYPLQYAFNAAREARVPEPERVENKGG